MGEAMDVDSEKKDTKKDAKDKKEEEKKEEKPAPPLTLRQGA